MLYFIRLYIFLCFVILYYIFGFVFLILFYFFFLYYIILYYIILYYIIFYVIIYIYIIYIYPTISIYQLRFFPMATFIFFRVRVVLLEVVSGPSPRSKHLGKQWASTVADRSVPHGKNRRTRLFYVFWGYYGLLYFIMNQTREGLHSPP